MGLMNRALEVIETERRDPPPNKDWFFVQVRRFESEAEELANIGYCEPSGSSRRQEAFAARDLLFDEVENWKRLYGHLSYRSSQMDIAVFLNNNRLFSISCNI